MLVAQSHKAGLLDNEEIGAPAAYLRLRREESTARDGTSCRDCRYLLPVTHDYEHDRFVVRRAGQVLVTPLLLVLLAVETTDVIFALDSISAIFAVTRESVSGLYLQRLRYSRPALVVLRVRECDGQVLLPEVRLGSGAVLRWCEDGPGQYLSHSDSTLARSDRGGTHRRHRYINHACSAPCSEERRSRGAGARDLCQGNHAQKIKSKH